MKKIAILSVLLALLLSVSGLATETRVLTMGDNNMLLLDEANIFLFPSRLYEYPSLVVGEFGSDGFSEFGVHWKLGKKDNPWYLATYLQNDTRKLPELWENPFITNPGYGVNPIVPFDKPSFMDSNKRIDLLYGRMWGKSQFGFHFGMVHSSERNDRVQVGVNNDARDNESLGIYKVNTGFTLNEGLLDIAAGLDIVSFKDKGTDTTGVAIDETKSKGNSKLHFTARSFYEYSPAYTFIPHVELSFAKYEAEFFRDTLPDHTDTLQIDIVFVNADKYTRTIFDLGLGVEYVPADNVLAVLDFGLMFNKLKGEFFTAGLPASEANIKTITFPYFKIGFDADVFKWMDVRFGATSYWQNKTTEDVTTNSDFIQRYPSNTTYLGFGFHWNRLHIDTQTDPNLFLRGLDFINSKANNFNDMNMRLSVVYDWM